MIRVADPHNRGVDAIVAAASAAVRSALADFTRAADFAVGAMASSPDSLAGLLRPPGSAWIVTGDTAAAARPFLHAAHAARAPAVALLSGADGGTRHEDLMRGGAALLQAPADAATFRIAVAASRAGLAVWNPGSAEAATLASPAAATAPRAARGGHDRPALTPRERDVLQLTGAGQSTKAVARQLGISANTVKFHLRAAFDKLGVASRAEAVMVAIRRGELAV